MRCQSRELTKGQTVFPPGLRSTTLKYKNYKPMKTPDMHPPSLMINVHAQALGRLGKGRKKTMTPDAIRQRREAAKARSRAAKARKELAYTTG